jgi:dimethylaniline monooxygenase (N-oxide forming)
MNWKQRHTSHFRNTYGTKNSGFAEAIANYGCQLKPGIAELHEHSVVFADGSEETIDEIVCCTGFQNCFSFLDDNHDDAIIQRVSYDARISHNLYKFMIHPLLGTSLVFIGFVRPCFGAIAPLAEMQARWFALLCSNKTRLPDAETMTTLTQIYVRYIENMLTKYRTDRITNLTDFIVYSDDLARQIGCRPDLGHRMLLSEPRLWLRCMLGPMCNAQYRLTGPHAQPSEARRILYTVKCNLGWLNVIEFVLLYFAALLWLCGFRKYKPLTWYPVDEWEM